MGTSKCQLCEQEVCKEEAWVTIASFNLATPRSAFIKPVKWLPTWAMQKKKKNQFFNIIKKIKTIEFSIISLEVVLKWVVSLLDGKMKTWNFEDMMEDLNVEMARIF